jgi:hypothetical protein
VKSTPETTRLLRTESRATRRNAIQAQSLPLESDRAAPVKPCCRFSMTLQQTFWAYAFWVVTPVLGRFATNCARRLPKSELKIVDRTQTGWRHYSGVCSAHWSPFPNGKFFAVRILGGDSVGSITACQISEECPKSFGRTHFGW